ncbi:membrane lipoprotein [Vibrio phage 1.187.O._10N.286.49.F1]|nr:membrane lipoprotein [Vibrio phage 1.187.O._10N.286.49.F1]
MKKVLGLMFTVGILTGCEYAPTIYQEAAEKFAEEDCEGIVLEVEHASQVVENYLKESHKMYYKCVSSVGTLKSEVIYSNIPVKYFKED